MAFRIIKLEERIVLDSAGAPVIAEASTHSVQDHSSETQDNLSDNDTDTHDVTHDADPTLVSPDDASPQPITESSSILIVSDTLPDADDWIGHTDDQTLVLRYSPSETTTQQLLNSIKDILKDTKVQGIAFAGDPLDGNAMALASDTVLSVSSLALNDMQQAFWNDIGDLIHDDGHIDLFCDGIADDTVNDFLADQVGLLSDRDVTIFHSMDPGTDGFPSVDSSGVVSVNEPADSSASFSVSHDTIDQDVFSESVSSALSGTVHLNGDDGSLNIILLDTSLTDYMDIANAAGNDAVVIFFDGTGESADDVISKAVDYANITNTSIDSLSILSHGTTGEFKLGTDWISSDNLSSYTDAWQDLDGVMDDGGNIYLFGCNVAGDSTVSQSLLDSLSTSTHTDVFASDDITGYGGDWDLEASSWGSYDELTSGLNTPLYADMLSDYMGTLAAPTIVSVTTVDNDGNGQIDYIEIVTDQNLDDDFSGFSATVDGYTLDATTPYVTNIGAGGANDNTFYIKVNESGFQDSNDTPKVTVTGNTTLSNMSAENLASTASSDTGWNYPSTDAGGAWSDTFYAYADDGNTSYGYIGSSQEWSGFGLSDTIPDGATIDGIEVRIDVTGGGSTNASLSWDGGSNFTSSNSYSLTGVQTVGSSSNDWGHTWTKDQLNDSNFRIRLTCTNLVGSWLDYIQIKVHYTYDTFVNADDFNDAPVATDDTVSLPDSASNGSSVHSVAASDYDTDATLTYSITAGNDDNIFAINANTGEITVTDNTNLDVGTTASYDLSVQVSDGTNTDTAGITVNIYENDFTPVADDATVDLIETAANGTSVHTVSATDADTGASLSYSITGGNDDGVFSIDANTGEITVSDNSTLDSGTTPAYNLTVLVSDGFYSDSATITVNVDGFQITHAVTVDNDGDGQIDHIQLTTNDNLDDDFSGLNLSVDGYTLDATTPYLTTLDAGGTNDNVFYVKINESGSSDTNATPLVTLTGNTSLSSVSGMDLGSWQTGTLLPTASIAGGDWSNPDNALTDDGSSATTTSTGDIQIWSFSNLNIPDNANITGITVEIDSMVSGGLFGRSGALNVDLWNQSSGSYTSADNYSLPDGSLSVETLGGSSDIWGETWTSSDFSDGTFKVRVNVTELSAGIGTPTASIDDIKITVNYEPTITADDMNDRPVATTDSVTVNEEVTATTTLSGTDADVDDYDTVTQYRIDSLPTNGTLQLDGTDVSVNDIVTQADIDGNLLTFVPDADFDGSTDFTYSAYDGLEWSTASATFTINFNALQDSPTIGDDTFSVSEGAGNGDTVGTVSATDPDTGNTLTYSITGGTGSGMFAIDSGTGEITVSDNSTFDAETTSSYSLTVQVTDGTDTDTATITVNMDDVNEFTPVADNATVSMDEDIANSTIIHTVAASDNDASATLTYSITGGNGDGVFAIVPATGQISITDNSTIDRETTASYILTVQVTDGTNTDTATITVNVNDINDNSPTIGNDTFSVAEDAAVNDVVGTITASDADTGDTLTYAITGGNTGSVFAIDSDTGQITVNGALDFETLNSYSLTVQASDGTNTDTATITVNITDVIENNAPTIGNETFSIAEDAGISDSVGTVSANDADVGDSLTYTITAGNTGNVFAINTNTGEISVNGALDRETTASYNLTVQVSDGIDTDTATVTVNISDVNEFTPTANDATVSLAENAANGTSVHTMVATDTDPGDVLTYSITAGNGAGIFAINANTGQITVTDNTNLDHEAVSSYVLTVEASDGTNTDTADITVNVSDVNEFAPVATDDTVSLIENSANGTSVHTVAAADADATATLTYAITGGNGAGVFTIDANTGEITVADNTNLDREAAASFALTVTVSDGTLTDTAAITVNVTDVNEFAPTANDATVAVSENAANATSIHTVTANDPDATAVLAYAITGGNGDGVFTIDANTGEITILDNTTLDNVATPSYTLTVQVTDGTNTDTAAITVNVTDVNENAPVADNATVALDEDSANGTSVHTVTATDADPMDVLTYTIASGNDDGIFTINANTGEITVTDNSNLDRETTASYVLGIQVSDGTFADSATITVNINDINEFTPSAANATVSVTENSANGTHVHTVAASDNDATAVLTYTIAGGNGAGVFTIDANTGEITVSDNSNLNRETTASFALTVQVSDGTNTDTATITVNVNDINEFVPVATDNTVSLAENSANGTSVHTVAATDADSTATLTYAITGGNGAGVFAINANTGEIAVSDNTNLDREAAASFALTVQVSDGTNMDTASITVNVTDVNEFAPTANDSTLSLAENSANGTSVHTVVATDTDPDAVLTYSITGGNGAGVFTIDANTGEITVSDNSNLNRETTASFALTVQVSDGTNTGTGTITVNVSDVNEFAPAATDDTVSLVENSANGTSVHTVAATDADATASLTYAITGGNGAGVFTIDANTGEITVADNTNLDREAYASFSLTVDVSDGTNTDTATITVNVTDVNDSAPVVSDDTVSLAENSANGTSVHTVAATDADTGSILTYAITGGNGAGVFTIDANTGEIIVADNTNLDREAVSSFALTVTVSDGTNTQTGAITVNVTDVNEFAPVAADDTVGLAENSANGTPVHTVAATDADPDAVLTYAITGGNGAGVFTIDANTGEITVSDNTNLDRETFAAFALTVQVSDGTNTDTAAITVNVTDVSEFAPVATDDAVALAENSANGTSVHTVAATDADATAVLTYAITAGNDAGVFTIDAATGEITVADNTNLDREINAVFILNVAVNDGTLSDTAVITINVTDLNDNAPVANDATLSLAENSANGTSVHTVTATDADATSVLTYAITGGNGSGVFAIDANTGEITVTDNSNLNRETAASFALTVQVSDGTNTDTATMTVNVTDVNEFAPTANDATVSLTENSADGTSVHTVTATDADADAVLTYTITGGNGAGVFAIDANTGEITVADNTNLDREAAASFALAIQVSDGTNTDSATITINVTDVNDNAPSVTPATVSLVENAPNGTAVHTVTATDPDLGATVSYAIVGGNDNGVFTIDANTGDITVADNTNLDREAVESFSLAVQASDGSLSSTSTITVTVTDVNDNAPEFTDDSTTVQVRDDAENGDHVYTVTATDPDPDAVLTYSITGGNDDGIFTVDPVTGDIIIQDNTALQNNPDDDTYTLTVDVTDGVNGNTSTVTITISTVIEDAPPTEEITGGDNPFPDDLGDIDQIDSGEDIAEQTDSTDEDGQDEGVLDDSGIEENTEAIPENSEEELAAMSVQEEPESTGGSSYLSSRPGSSGNPFRLTGNSIDITPYMEGLDYSESVDALEDYLSRSGDMSDPLYGPDRENGRNDQLWVDIDTMKREIRDDATLAPETEATLVASAVTGFVTLVAGYVAWINKIFSFVISLFTSSPLWQSFDPIPIFDAQNQDEGSPEAWEITPTGDQDQQQKERSVNSLFEDRP